MPKRRATRSCPIPFVDALPKRFTDHITGTKDVKADGHCGFRVVADQLIPGGEDSFHRVRADMYHSLLTHPEWYVHAFVEVGSTDEVLLALNSGDIEKAGPEHWFRLPEMPHIVATVYNVAVVALSPRVSVTYLPLRTAPPPNGHFYNLHGACE